MLIATEPENSRAGIRTQETFKPELRVISGIQEDGIRAQKSKRESSRIKIQTPDMRHSKVIGLDSLLECY